MSRVRPRQTGDPGGTILLYHHEVRAGIGRGGRRAVAGRDLTAREREVAALVAEGLSSRDVAGRLGISERTVDNCVRELCGKLGVSSRVQIAAQLATHGGAGSGRLPASLSSFVGREAELTEVSSLAASRRLVTLVGPGGVGKTRLAIEVARLLEHRFGDGADFVDLSGMADGELVEESVLAALGLHSDTRRGAREVLADGLRGRHLLLVLDNCEHVLDACRPLLDHLLSSCGRLHVLATSREPLLLRGERVRHVTPMTLPDAGEPLAADALRRHSALRLFVERAEEGGGAFPIGPRTPSRVRKCKVAFVHHGVPRRTGKVDFRAPRAGSSMGRAPACVRVGGSPGISRASPRRRQAGDRGSKPLRSTPLGNSPAPQSPAAVLGVGQSGPARR